MLGERILCIQNLIITVPDDVQAADGRSELTIDEILEWFLQYRKTAECVVHNNRYGNFAYFSADIPDGVNPENPNQFTLQEMMNYLGKTDDTKKFAGIMTSLVYDPDLESYRNAYLKKDQEEFEIRKAAVLEQRRFEQEALAQVEKASEDAVIVACSDCNEICDENCPNDSYHPDLETES